MPLLEVQDLHASFAIRQGTVRAVDGVSFTLEEGESLGLVGESGCGKTTAALSLLRLLPPNGRIDSGKILYQGRDVLTFNTEELRRFRWKEISIIFQGAMNALNPVQRVGDQIAEAIRLHQPTSEKEAGKQAQALLERVELEGRRVNDYPHEFSGGQRQRVMIAMALACRPRIVIGDEPTTALDVMVQAQIFELVESLRKELGMAMILITHDLSVLGDTCDRAAVMYAGQIVEIGPIEILFKSPCHPYARCLLRSFPRLQGPRSMADSIPGTPPNLIEVPPGCRFHPRCQEVMAICSREQPLLLERGPRHSVACHLYGRGIDGA
jgi:oligopeptide/dipeptide ABC transporter ATP-binding protein